MLDELKSFWVPPRHCVHRLEIFACWRFCCVLLVSLELSAVCNRLLSAHWWIVKILLTLCGHFWCVHLREISEHHQLVFDHLKLRSWSICKTKNGCNHIRILNPRRLKCIGISALTHLAIRINNFSYLSQTPVWRLTMRFYLETFSLFKWKLLSTKLPPKNIVCEALCFSSYLNWKWNADAVRYANSGRNKLVACVNSMRTANINQQII